MVTPNKRHHSTSRSGRRAARRAALVLKCHLLLTIVGIAAWPLSGCANSPYRTALREMNRPAAARLADRVADVSVQYASALAQFEDAATRLDRISSAQSAPTEWEIYRCRDAVELCDWWAFNLDRVNQSIQDLAPREGSASAVGGAAEESSATELESSEAAARCSLLIEELEFARRAMLELTVEFSATLAALEAGGTPQPVPDLTSLRRVVAAAVAQAEQLAAELRTEPTGSRQAVAPARSEPQP